MKTLTLSRPTMRYSPKPIEEYGRSIEGKLYGPSESLLIKGDDAAWNLAYLSFDFESRPVSPDPNFTTLVHRTLAVGEVRAWLKDTAPRFLYRLHQSEILATLPLYLAYGLAWPELMLERSRKAATYTNEPEVEPLYDTAQAVHLLSQFTGKK